MTTFALRWTGAILVARARAATIRGLEETAARCVIRAKQLVRVRTATLQGSLRYDQPTASGGSATIEWGSFDVNYAIYQELGTRYMTAQPYLRPAADAEYPGLVGRIRVGLAGL